MHGNTFSRLRCPVLGSVQVLGSVAKPAKVRLEANYPRRGPPLERAGRLLHRAAGYSVLAVQKQLADARDARPGEVYVEKKLAQALTAQTPDTPPQVFRVNWRLGLTWVDQDSVTLYLSPFSAAAKGSGEDETPPVGALRITVPHDRAMGWVQDAWQLSGQRGVPVALASPQMAMRGVLPLVFLPPSIRRKSDAEGGIDFHTRFSADWWHAAEGLVRFYGFASVTALLEHLVTQAAGLDCRGSPYATPRIRADQEWYETAANLPTFRTMPPWRRRRTGPGAGSPGEASS